MRKFFRGRWIDLEEMRAINRSEEARRLARSVRQKRTLRQKRRIRTKRAAPPVRMQPDADGYYFAW